MNPQDKYTQVKFNKDAIDAIYEGVKEVCEATATTLGPMGRNVLIDKGYTIKILHDGVSVADSINPEEEYKRAGARVIQEAAKKQRDSVGDGTTAVMVLTKAILDRTLEVTSSGVNPMSLRKGLESGAAKIVKALEDKAIPVKTLAQKIEVATISAEDETLGKLVAETIHKIGSDGVITVEESKAQETYVEQQDGMQFDKGLVHRMLITDDDRQMAVAEDTHVLVTDIPLNNIAEIGKFFDSQLFPNTKKCLFISPEIGGDFLNVLVGTKVSGQFLGLGMRAPGVGYMQAEMLQDICALTGATFVSKEAGHKINDMTFDVLGKLKVVKQSLTSTVLVGGGGHKEDVAGRIQVIRKQMEDETVSDYDQEQLKGRLARLTNGIAVIKVGGQTQVETDERKERVIDAVAATQAAVRHGLIAGGEISYLGVSSVLNESILGEKILKDAIKEPFKRLVSNAGYDSGEKLADLYRQIATMGFDVVDGKFKDMVKSGIVDPVSVPVSAVKTAVSVAVQLSSLGAAVVQMNEVSKL